MFKGFYTAASGMLTQQRRTEMLTNNMSNANTPGYKEDQSSIRAFPEMLLSSIDGAKVPVDNSLRLSQNRTVGALNTGVYMQETRPAFGQGDLKVTNNQTDVAIQEGSMPTDPDTNQKGTVMFAVGTPNGIRYTRNGNFTLDGQGYLTTPSGMYVLDDQQQRIQLKSDDFIIHADGTIQEGNESKGRMGMHFSNTPSLQLIKEGDGLYRTNETTALPSAYVSENVQFALTQGSIEQSNVDASKTMTNMLTAYRSFEANQKILQAYDQSMQKVANEVGRIG